MNYSFLQIIAGFLILTDGKRKSTYTFSFITKHLLASGQTLRIPKIYAIENQKVATFTGTKLNRHIIYF